MSVIIGQMLSHVARLITISNRDDSAAHFVRGRAHSVGQVKCILYKEVKFSMCHGQFHFHMSHAQHELEYYNQFILTLPLNIFERA